MSKLRKNFGNFNMTWGRVLLFALLAGVYTGVVAGLGFLKDTSFQDIAVTFEWWILFAVFIVVNCKTWWEASLKCFVFFLVSQPLVYLVQIVLFGSPWSLFGYYKYWGVVTILTLPGAAVAFLVKKKNWLSVLVLSVATGLLAYQGVMYANMAIHSFPHHLLSAIACLAIALFLIFILFDEKKHRALAVCLFAAVLVVSAALTVYRTGGGKEEIMLDEGTWICSVEDESIVRAEITDGNHVTLRARRNGDCTVVFTDENGVQRECWVTNYNGQIFYSFLDEID